MEKTTERGTRIIASVTIDDVQYYIDEYRYVYEKFGERYLNVDNANIVERVRSILLMPSQGDILE